MKYGLTTLIDDRADCLASFGEEGPLSSMPPGTGKLLQACWAPGTKKSKNKNHVPCYNWANVLEELEVKDISS